MSAAVAAVTLFVAVLSGAAMNEVPDPKNNNANVFIGQSQGYVTETVQGFGIEYNNFEIQCAQQGNRNERVAEGTTDMCSVTRVIRPAWISHQDWQPKFRIGPSYVSNSPFVGNTNTHLGVGIEYKSKLSLERTHYSSGGTHPTNTGLDDIRLGIHFQF